MKFARDMNEGFTSSCRLVEVAFCHNVIIAFRIRAQSMGLTFKFNLDYWYFKFIFSIWRFSKNSHWVIISILYFGFKFKFVVHVLKYFKYFWCVQENRNFSSTIKIGLKESLKIFAKHILVKNVVLWTFDERKHFDHEIIQWQPFNFSK